MELSKTITSTVKRVVFDRGLISTKPRSKATRVTVGGAIFVLLLVGCVPNQRIMNSSEGPPAATNVAPAKSGFEQDLESMRTADFRFIYVFRRKDGGALDGDDKGFASRNIPVEMNRRALSDSEKAIIVGSNYKIPDENLKILTERFAFEDRSPTE